MHMFLVRFDLCRLLDYYTRVDAKDKQLDDALEGLIRPYMHTSKYIGIDYMYGIPQRRDGRFVRSRGT